MYKQKCRQIFQKQSIKFPCHTNTKNVKNRKTNQNEQKQKKKNLWKISID